MSHCPKLRNILFGNTENKDRQQIFTIEKLKQVISFDIFANRTINGFSGLMQIYFFVGCLTEKLATFFSSAFKKKHK